MRDAPGKVGKREISRAFGIKGAARTGLKRLLADMADQGLIAKAHRRVRVRGQLPPVAVIAINGRDTDGELVAAPVEWSDEDGDPPSILVGTGSGPALGVGDRVLARLQRLPDGEEDGFAYQAVPIKRLAREDRPLLGIFKAHAGGGGTIVPVSRKFLKDWSVARGDVGPAKDGDLVRFKITRSGRGQQSGAQITETLGNPSDDRKISLIAVHAHGIPDEFPARVLEELDSLKSPTKAKRQDLRDLPLITIDPADARDHDDAVHAEIDSDPANPGGFAVTVAIADVAHYVRPGTNLDKEALLRGNSVYFPDRVVPMLPERISNDLCSLREGEERPCLAVRMIFDKSGRKRGHTFVRGLMRSAAKLSYQDAQAAIDGEPNAKCQPLLATVLEPLWAAYRAVSQARDKRQPLDLDLPERKITVGADGHVEAVTVPQRLDAHRLIEEFMIQANVSAAETLESRKAPIVYRTHGPPTKEKVRALADFLTTLKIKLVAGGELRPMHLNRILAGVRGQPVSELVSEVVLRSQAQAEYSVENIGHFGLNLRRYAHFTSPIRRYADLIVHRALVSALGLGAGAISDSEVARLSETASQISDFERRAMAAERETVDRLIAFYLANQVGEEFQGRISGVTRSGLFVRLADTGADGFVPASTLGADYYQHDEGLRALVGQRTGETFQLGDSVDVRLVEAIPTAGALRFEILNPGKNISPRKRRASRPPRRGGGAKRRARRPK